MKFRKSRWFESLVILTVLVFGVTATTAYASAVLNLPGFNTNVLPANDDGSTGQITLPFSVNFFGVTFNHLWVNNNGNVTFDSALGTFTPFDLNATNSQIIAPFFGDVDTRGTGSGLVHYGTDMINGHQAFGVEWPAVGYFGSHADKLNTFELALISRPDTGANNFDIEYNYNQIQWETGDASGGTNGLGGSCARAGYANGTGAPGTHFEITGSAVCGAFLDTGPDALISHSINSNVLGRYIFESRGGSIITGVPEPGSLSLLGLGLAGMAGSLARKRGRWTLLGGPRN